LLHGKGFTFFDKRVNLTLDSCFVGLELEAFADVPGYSFLLARHTGRLRCAACLSLLIWHIELLELEFEDRERGEAGASLAISCWEAWG
jgi:hypothetical protein